MPFCKISKLILEKINSNSQLIENWFNTKNAQPLLYNSVDLRHATYKIAPVDTNCFPAGFNNLAPESKQKAKHMIDAFFNKYHPQAKKVLIIPESHTRNLSYLENVRFLTEIVGDKREVQIGTLIPEISEPTKIGEENPITLNPLLKKDSRILTQSGFEPDLIISNNDFTAGVAEILTDLSQPIIPNPNLGWYRRAKSNHFTIYNALAAELGELINLDPWLFSTFHRSCHDINFKEQIGLEGLAKYIDELISLIKKKYDFYGIKTQPYCYVKADNGTYGMAIMTVFSGEELMDLNKKDRNKMNMLKGSVQNTMVMLQEGIETIDKVNHKTSEPMIYLIGGEVVSNLFRTNELKDELGSLNSSGMTFHDLATLKNEDLDIGGTSEDMAKVYRFIARLAALAASLEK